MPTESYYEILGVNRTATAEEIKIAYHKLAKQYHPDRTTDPKLKNEYEEKFKLISKAYTTLKDPETRSYYDKHGVDPKPESNHENRSTQTTLERYTKDLERFLELSNAFKRRYAKHQRQIFRNAKTYNKIIKALDKVYSNMQTSIEAYNLLPFSEFLSIDLLNDFIGMMQAIMNDTTLDYVGFKTHIFNFANQQLKNLKSNNKELINYFINAATGLSLSTLEIDELDEQIERIKNLPVDPERKSLHEDFVASTINLRNKIFNDLEKDEDDVYVWEDSTKSKHTFNEAKTVLKNTTSLLKKITLLPENQEKEYKAFAEYHQQYTEATPKFKNFAKSIATVVSSGIGMVLGFTLGAIAGALMALMAPPLIALTVPYMGILIAFEGARIGRDVGKKLLGVPASDSVWNMLFFKPTNVPQKANVLAQKGKKLVDVPEVTERSRLIPTIA